MARSVERVRDYLHALNSPIEVQELPNSTRTAQLAAEAVGSQLGQIVKSLIFIDEQDHTILALVAGDRRADPARIASVLGVQSVRIANAEEVRARTGYAIGGVPPVAHAEGNLHQTLMDRSLLRFDKVWAAAGAPNAVFPIERARLAELADAQIQEIASD
ncbi:MAG: YbaK/EbsC family protein [Anaerolineae bacterium]